MPPTTAAAPAHQAAAFPAVLVATFALVLALAGCGTAPGSTPAAPTGGIGGGLVDGTPGADAGVDAGADAGVPDLPKELVPANTFIVDTRVRDGALTVRMSSGLSEGELVDFYTQALRDLGADPAVGSEGGARVIEFESDVGSGSVRITEGTPTTIELVLRS
jgi:hypothetical protein